MVLSPKFKITDISCRLSQDLAKDLAILAREIHDVAGDGEPPSVCPAASTEATEEKVWSQSLF